MELPIIERFVVEPTQGELARIETMAERLRQRPELASDSSLTPLLALDWPAAPELQIDDQSDIPTGLPGYDPSYLQDRARLRAVDGDVIVCNSPPAEEYEAYCRDYLGLGSARWLWPQSSAYRRHLASHSWKHRKVRRDLIRAIRSDGLRTIHPLMGSQEVWQLASLLHRATRIPIRILAPPPELARWVNNKTEFASTVTELFGESSLPLTRHATSLALVSRHVRDIAEHHAKVGLKLPDAAGGSGNLVMTASEFRGESLDNVAKRLKKLLRTIGWRSGDRLLVSAWESEILSSPSVQVWIPAGAGAPIVEGIFEQDISSSYEFVGTRPAELPEALNELVARQCWLLASLYQKLGYVGRCSFDLVLVGRTIEDCRAELIECNGRWGGTSLPMTLMHRLFGSRTPNYVVRTIAVDGLARLRFPDLLQCFETDLYDVRTGRGHLVIFGPARIQARSALSYIVHGETNETVQQTANRVVKRLRESLRWRGAWKKPGIP